MTDSDSPMVTVFTPTYNRASTLGRVYQSLARQDYDDFEWVIVDDDSEDETATLVGHLADISDFPIRFKIQDRPGKHRAWNQGVGMARGEFFVPLDSDDTLDPNALERLDKLWEQVPAAKRGRVLGVSALCVDQRGNLVGDEFPESKMLASYFQLRYEYGIQGDRVQSFRTAVLETHQFPELDSVRYVPESYVWSEIAAEGYVYYCVNEVLGTYYTGEDDRDDQLTQAANHRDSEAFFTWHRRRLNDHVDWLAAAPRPFVSSAAGYAMHGFLTGRSIREQWNGLDSWRGRLLWLGCLPVGYLAARLAGTDAE